MKKLTILLGSLFLITGLLAQVPGWDKILAINNYWTAREQWIDMHRNDFIMAFQWVKSNVHYREWNPLIPIARIQGRQKLYQQGTVFMDIDYGVADSGLNDRHNSGTCQNKDHQMENQPARNSIDLLQY